MLSDSTLFDGFLVGESDDVWNQTPWQSIAVPNGFRYTDIIDYSDVGVLINNLSAQSRTIGWAFVAARNISLDRVFLFDLAGTPTGETINRDQFNTYFALPFLAMLQNRSTSSSLNYLVTTKGIPLRVSGGVDAASFDQELSLLGGSYNNTIGNDYWFYHDYGPMAGNPMEPFTRNDYGFFLVTRLTGYTVETALELIERANQSLGQRGTFVLDLATNRNGSGYKFWNDDLYAANTTLNGTMDLPVVFDEETNFVTNISDVIGYASWGSNDGNWYQNYLPNSGFDTVDAIWPSGARYWEVNSPVVSGNDVFNWSQQNITAQGGNYAFEASIETTCGQISTKMLQGIYGEFFDNNGISITTTTMPKLIDRIPDRIQLESTINHASSSNAYAGLDDRFKVNWGARLSGFIDIPEDGNWTFFLNSDDGSEFWMDGVSLVQNHGTHGMVEKSSYLNLTAGLHDFRVEFFQGGGPHGLILSWQGPNTTKAAIPASAFYVSSDVIPQSDQLIHYWPFEDGAGNTAEDMVNSSTNLTLNGMNASNWMNCTDGQCLWYDGINDFSYVDVDDWSGNLTVSQWVWANTSNQTTYAATFAVNDQAGSNLSFQHMIANQKWNLHNNQSSSFGDVRPQRWVHLVTVFDAGTIRQYMDGILVQTNTYPNGSFTNIDMYKLGVNRAGSAFFEGMIDEVMVWNTALQDQDITSLRRTIIDSCDPFSGGGVDVASLETNFVLPSDLTGHAWVIYVYGLQSGQVNGAYGIEIEALDASGGVLSTNLSNMNAFTTGWTSQTMRFRPQADATTLKIRIPLDIATSSVRGSFFIDSVVLRAIRPHMDWVNGSIADTAVSTGGRSFNWGTGYGQSLIADLLEDGVSGVKGYVYEPYLTAVGAPSILLPTYASGYNLAESHAAANRISGWMGVVVGDPKMAAYADIFHDVNIIDARILGKSNLGENVTVQILLENRGMSSSNGTISIRTVLGNAILNQTALVLPAGDEVGSRTLVNLTIIPTTQGQLDLRVRYDNTTQERNFANNILSFSILVNAPPIINDVYCSSLVVTRGAYTICSIEATDDFNITEAILEWQILAVNATLNDSLWTSIVLGKINANTWEASLIIPSSANLGMISMRATVKDSGNMSVRQLFANVTQVVDAVPEWYGPHVKGVDSPSWNNASHLPNKPQNGLLRNQMSLLTVCVLDADYSITEDAAPLFSASRGSLGNVSYIPQQASHLYCYVATFNLSIGSSLDDVRFEIRSPSGILLLQRTIRVRDTAPELMLQIEDSEGNIVDRLVGDGTEAIRVIVDDADDPDTSFVGDISIQYPGGDPILLPLDIPAGHSSVLIPLSKLMVPLEAGEVVLIASGVGMNGGLASAELSVPFLLTPPEIIMFETCDVSGEVRAMTFGQIAILTVGVKSDRPLASSYAQLTQLGWSISAPATSEVPWDVEHTPDACNTTEFPQLNVVWLYFRLKLDNSLVDGNGKVVFSISDIDGLSTSKSLDLLFQHAPTEFLLIESSSAIPTQDLFTNLTLADLDGLDTVVCSYNLYGPEGQLLSQSTLMGGEEGYFENTLVWQYPIPRSLSNTTLSYNITCIDDLLDFFTKDGEIAVGEAPECTSCQEDKPAQTEVTETTSTSTKLFFASLAIALLIVALSAFFIINRDPSSRKGTWGDTEIFGLDTLEDLFETDTSTTSFEVGPQSAAGITLPVGWTLEAFERWLDGETPDGWSEEQWKEYVIQQKAAITATQSQG